MSSCAQLCPCQQGHKHVPHQKGDAMKALQPSAWLRHSRSLSISLTILLLLGSLGVLLALQISHPAYAAGDLQINAGGGAADPFIADTDFCGGLAGPGTPKAIDTSKVTNPPPQAVYQTDRVGNF